MNIKQLILGNTFLNKKHHRENKVNNPFLKGAEGRQEWNDRYMNMSHAVTNWQRAFFLMAALSAVLGGVVAKLALSTKIHPFVVETHQGVPYAISPLADLDVDDGRLLHYALNQFIINAKTVMTDKEGQRQLLHKAYAYTAEGAVDFLNNFYKSHNPLTVENNETVMVEISNVLPLGKNTWQIMWNETHKKADGISSPQVSRWVAHITYALGEINPDTLNENPFGLYVTELSWSKSQPFKSGEK